MKVRSQLLLILLAVVLGISGLSLLLKLKISNETKSLLLQRVIDTSEKDAPKVLQLNAADIKGYAFDYSVWDQMVNFVTVRKDVEWAREELELSLSNYNIDYIWVLDSNAKEYYYCTPNARFPDTAINIPETLLKNDLQVRKFKPFFIAHNNALVEIFPGPIQPTADHKRETAPKGYLLLGRIVDSAYLANLKNISPEINFTLVSPGNAYTKRINTAEGELEFSMPLKGYDGISLAAFNVSRKYAVIGSYQQFLNKYLVYFLLIIIFIGILFFQLVQSLILSPLASLSGALQQNNAEDLSLYNQQKNEFGDLSRLITSFFMQNKKLEEEIETRKRSEAALQNALAGKEMAETEKIQAEDFLEQQLAMLKLHSSINDLDFDEIIKKTIAHGATAIHCERVGIWLYDENVKSIKSDNIYKLSLGQYVKGDTIYEKDYPRYFSHLKKDLMIIAEDARTDAATAEFANNYLIPAGISSMMDVPIRSANKIIGIVCYEHVGPKRKWTISEQVFARSLSDIIAITFERKERSKAEDALKKNQIRFEETQELAHIGSWEFNFITTEVACSKEVFRIFDLENTPAEKMYDAYSRRIHPDDRLLIKNAIKKALHEGEISSAECRIICNNNVVKYILAIAEPLKSRQQKKIIGLRGTVQDITRQKQADMAKSEFLSCMSHEIRTPINGVIGIANLLLEEELSEKQKEYVTTLNFSAQHLSTVVSDILDFSKIESGHMAFEKVSFNLENNCQYIFNLFSQKAAEKNIAFDFIPSPIDNFSLYGDYVRLNQVLSNLLSNAIKFTDKGGVVFSYTIKKQNADKVTVLFSIKDSGIGISENQQHQIFESFTQADETITRQYGGTGLGLTICKKLVELQGGIISVNSEPGNGSEFIVELTYDNHVYEEQTVAKITTAEKNQHKDLGGMKILVAEDNHVNAMVLTRFLTKWNIESKVAKDGAEALAMLTKENFDIVLMDIQMPNIDGVEATKIIRQSQEEMIKNIPVVAFTADASVDTHKELLKIGFNHCMTKPFNPEVLFSFLKKKYEAA